MLHGYIKTKKYLVAQEVENDLRDIIEKKFNNLLKIECHISDGEICDWNIKYDSTHGFPVCLKTNERLEFTHPIDYWSCWAQVVIEDELALRYNGEMSDEEYPHQKIEPQLERHKTFQTYLESIMHHSKCWKQAIIAIEIANLPQALKKF